MRFLKYLTERIIVVGKGQKYGQVIILAGGAASGKGFAAQHFIDDTNFKYRNVDDWKTEFQEIAKMKNKYPEIQNLDLKKPEDVFTLHAFVKKKGIKEKTLNLLLSTANRDRLPNIIFDITLDQIDDLKKISNALLATGYDQQNIHLIWVLANYQVAIVANKERQRVVPDDVMLQTHTGATQNMYDIIFNKISGIVPELVDGQIDVILNNRENTLVYFDPLRNKAVSKFRGLYGDNKMQNDPKQVEKMKKKDEHQIVIKAFKYLKVKEEGKPIKSELDIKKQLLDWINTNKPEALHVFTESTNIKGE